MTHEHRDTVVVENDRSGSGMGAILGIIAIDKAPASTDAPAAS